MARSAFVLVRSRHHGFRHHRTPSARRSRADALAERRHLKRHIWKECRRRCVYCAREVGLDEMTLDHVIPRALGGHSHADNLVSACRDCNVRKGSDSPALFFLREPWSGLNFLRLAHAIARQVKRAARRAVSLAGAELETASRAAAA
ncbi:MAG: HNH endonuclease [Gemmatimonadaceae bacterium]